MSLIYKILSHLSFLHEIKTYTEKLYETEINI